MNMGSVTLPTSDFWCKNLHMYRGILYGVSNPLQGRCLVQKPSRVQRQSLFLAVTLLPADSWHRNLHQYRGILYGVIYPPLADSWYRNLQEYRGISMESVTLPLADSWYRNLHEYIGILFGFSYPLHGRILVQKPSRTQGKSLWGQLPSP